MDWSGIDVVWEWSRMVLSGAWWSGLGGGALIEWAWWRGLGGGVGGGALWPWWRGLGGGTLVERPWWRGLGGGALVEGPW